MATLGWPHPGIDSSMYSFVTDKRIEDPTGIGLSARGSDDSAFELGGSRENSNEQGTEERISRLESSGEHISMQCILPSLVKCSFRMSSFHGASHETSDSEEQLD